jgi:hypothetical protein
LDAFVRPTEYPERMIYLTVEQEIKIDSANIQKMAVSPNAFHFHWMNSTQLMMLLAA